MLDALELSGLPRRLVIGMQLEKRDDGEDTGQYFSRGALPRRFLYSHYRYEMARGVISRTGLLLYCTPLQS